MQRSAANECSDYSRCHGPRPLIFTVGAKLRRSKLHQGLQVNDPYANLAEEHKKAKHHHPWRLYIEDFILFELIGDLTGKTVLDLACGEGFYTRRIKQRSRPSPSRALEWLTTLGCVVIFSNMKAVALIRRRVVLAEDAVAEVAIWRVSQPVSPSRDGFKYRLAFTSFLRRINWWLTSTPKLRGGIMNTVVLEVRSLAETLADAARVMKTGRAERDARISFATPELLCQVLTAA
jgi:hypothetical protein